MAKVRELCGMIHTEYDHEADFAKALGWSKQKLNRITTGQREPDLCEVAQISACLQVPLEKVAQIFLRYKSPNGQHQGG